jgi:hypothetical protein
VKTPVSATSRLTNATEQDECVYQKQYQSAVGSLMYLSVSTTPDISYSVGSLARFNSSPQNVGPWNSLLIRLMHVLATQILTGLETKMKYLVTSFFLVAVLFLEKVRNNDALL